MSAVAVAQEITPVKPQPSAARHRELDNFPQTQILNQVFTDKYVRSNFENALDQLQVKLRAMGKPSPNSELTPQIEDRVRDVAALNRAWFSQSCPVYQRIEASIAKFTEGTSVHGLVHLPGLDKTLICDKPGMAYLASLPEDPDPERGRIFKNEYIESFELVEDQGVCHNTRHDRRTTGKETFHIADYGYSVPYDKTAVQCEVAARILKAALNPPKEDMVLPFTSNWGENRAETFVSLLVNPTVVPGVAGFTQEQALETLVLAPGGLASNLDFIERIFGNAGNQFRAEDNLALNPEHWTGDTGVIIFAPHLTKTTLQEMGIDSESLDGSNQDIKMYNDGKSFLLKIRDRSGVVITIIADNYFGLGKKTIMTDVSFSADRRGLALQEHAGGTLVFSEHDLGTSFNCSEFPAVEGAVQSYGEALELSNGEFLARPEGYAIDALYPNHLLFNETAIFTLNNKCQQVNWTHDNKNYSMNLDPEKLYFLPNGMSVRMQRDEILERDTNLKVWKLIGRSGSGKMIHKSDSVSGAGKTELSKPVDDLLRAKQLSVSNLQEAREGVRKLLTLHQAHSEVFKSRLKDGPAGSGRGALDPTRSLTSLVKLITTSPEFTEEYNALIRDIPDESKLMLAHLHMIQSSGMDVSDWRERFGVNKVNRSEGRYLYFDGKPVPVGYMRVGTDASGDEILLMLRPDYWKSFFIKQEDDLTSSILVPTPPDNPNKIIKGIKTAVGWCARIVKNMERRYFNRTDGTKVRGAELKGEKDIADDGNFFTNFEPCPISEADKIVANRVEFEKYTADQQRRILSARELHRQGKQGYFVVSDRARIIADGSRSTNPRYLENDDSLVDFAPYRQAEIASRLRRNVSFNEPIYHPVDIIAPARRLNTTDYIEDTGTFIPHIAIYPPMIMQDIPELMEDIICSVTGKSPSTTGGLGSEGAGTKGPFNCMPHVHYLNNQIRALSLSQEPVITTAAERIGPKHFVGHDLSTMAKEIFARVERDELERERLLRLGFIAIEPDVEHDGKVAKGGSYYYFTEQGMLEFFGRVFLSSDKAWLKEQIHPWEQRPKLYVEGKETLERYRKEIALKYFNDHSIGLASEPLRAILHMMAFDHYTFTPQGASESVTWTRESPDYRALFSRDAVLSSREYHAALEESQRRDIELFEQQIATLDKFLRESAGVLMPADRIKYEDRITRLRRKVGWAGTDNHLNHIRGSVGADKLALGPALNS